MPKVSSEYEQAQRERILEGAAQCFADKGYRQTSIDEIARNLGISKGAVYIYFKSKEELFVAIFAQYLAEDRASLDSCAADTAPLQIKLEKVLDSFLASLFDAEPVRARLLPEFWTEAARLPALQKLRDENKKIDRNLLVKLLEQGAITGEVRADLNITEVVEIILATCEGIMVNNLTGRTVLSREEIKRAVWNTFALVILPPN